MFINTLRTLFNTTSFLVVGLYGLKNDTPTHSKKAFSNYGYFYYGSVLRTR